MNRAAAVILLSLAATSPALAQDETIGIRWREWFATIDGHLQGQGDVLPSTDIDLTSTLGLDEQTNAHELQLVLNIPFFGRFYAGYWWADFEGTETLTRAFTFADRSFSAGTTVDSTLDLDMYYLTYEFGLPTIPLGGDQMKVDIGIQAGLRALLAEASIENALFSAEDSGGTGIPVLGVHAAVQVTPFLRGEFELVGMGVSYGTTSLRYFECFGEVVGQVGPLFAGLGYKWASLDLRDDRGDVDLEVDIRLDGLYVTAGLRF